VRNRGLTLVEVLIALAVVAVLSALALPAVWGRVSDAKVRAASRQVEAAVSSVRAHAQRDGRAFSLIATVDNRGTRLIAEPVEEATEGNEAGTAGRRMLGVLARDVMLSSEAAENGQTGRSSDEVVSQPLRVLIALPDGTVVPSGPVRLAANGVEVVITVNRWTGECKISRPPRPDATEVSR
jgi:prepilin-type N-terminal cleavage/methylation domain-containing protein